MNDERIDVSYKTTLLFYKDCQHVTVANWVPQLGQSFHFEVRDREKCALEHDFERERIERRLITKRWSKEACKRCNGEIPEEEDKIEGEDSRETVNVDSLGL